MDIKETKDLLDTDPDLYVGYPVVDPVTGELSTGKKKKGEKGEDVNDEDLHADPLVGVPDEKKPSIAPPLPEDITFIKVVDEKGVIVLKETVTLPFLKQAYKQAQQQGYKMMWETKSGAGDMMPALFVKLYSNAISLKETRKEERVETMSEKKIESKQNAFYKNELMSVGILKPQSAPKQNNSLNEINPVRKALEIYYNSPNTIEKPVVTENPLVEEAKPKVEEKKELPKKRFPIIW
jgi:hypothetical protein